MSERNEINLMDSIDRVKKIIDMAPAVPKAPIVFIGMIKHVDHGKCPRPSDTARLLQYCVDSQLEAGLGNYWSCSRSQFADCLYMSKYQIDKHKDVLLRIGVIDSFIEYSDNGGVITNYCLDFERLAELLE